MHCSREDVMEDKIESGEGVNGGTTAVAPTTDRGRSEDTKEDVDEGHDDETIEFESGKEAKGGGSTSVNREDNKAGEDSDKTRTCEEVVGDKEKNVLGSNIDAGGASNSSKFVEKGPDGSLAKIGGTEEEGNGSHAGKEEKGMHEDDDDKEEENALEEQGVVEEEDAPKDNASKEAGNEDKGEDGDDEPDVGEEEEKEQDEQGKDEEDEGIKKEEGTPEAQKAAEDE